MFFFYRKEIKYLCGRSYVYRNIIGCLGAINMIGLIDDTLNIEF